MHKSPTVRAASGCEKWLTYWNKWHNFRKEVTTLYWSLLVKEKPQKHTHTWTSSRKNRSKTFFLFSHLLFSSVWWLVGAQTLHKCHTRLHALHITTGQSMESSKIKHTFVSVRLGLTAGGRNITESLDSPSAVLWTTKNRAGQQKLI